VEKGSYRGRRANFKDFTTSFFNPFLFTTDRLNLACGVCALSLLTGVAPEILQDRKRLAHTSDESMLNFLRRHGFRTLQLTQCNLSRDAKKLGSQHLILLSQLFRENEATWGVIYNGWYYHNFSIYELTSMAFLNKPILSAYLLRHPRCLLPANTIKPALPAPQKAALTWSELLGAHAASKGPKKITINQRASYATK